MKQRKYLPMISVYLDDDIIDFLKKRSQQLDTSMSKIVREVLEREMRMHTDRHINGPKNFRSTEDEQNSDYTS